ncbi:unnamed protein product [Spirodela intermedia]|uniref:Uncharacterized protein n=1 Tax=Spirodela intermedia TaxID=51605 RepID=A0A7I8IH02_SPIIN|nr:unnamed protein product [Spirodela intermedia]CAA6657163.1 unnamed protein product [Spirodela intermedia]
MASAQVMQNSAAGSSRKQGHLEAGKRRLEEFRKKKAEGKAKKAVSTGQLLSSDIDHLDKLPQDRGNVNDRATCDPDNNTTIELTRANTGSEMNAVGSSTSTKSVLSNVTEAVSINHDGTSHSGLQSKEQSRDDGAGSYKNFQLTRLMDDYYSQGWDKNHLHSERDPERKVSDKSVMRQGNVHSVYPNSKFDVKDNNSTLYSGDGLQEDKEQDKFEIVQSNPFYVPDKRSGFRSTGSFSNISLEETASTSYEDTYALQQRRPDTKNHDGAKALSGGGKLTNDLTSHHHDINSEHWRFAESPVDSASTLKALLLNFLPHLPPLSKFYGAEVQQLPSHKSDDKYFQGDASLASPHSFGRKESDLNFSASKSEDKLRKEVVDGDRKGMKDFSSSTKDEDFAALEQYTEQLRILKTE